MLNKTLNTSGEHPDILVEGKPAEIRSVYYAQFWISYCELIAEGKQPNIRQLAIEAETLIVRCGPVSSTEDLNSTVRDIQSYLRSVLVFDRLSDNDLRCIVTASEDNTSIYFPICRLIAKEIEAIHMPAIARLLKIKHDIDIIPFQAKNPVSLYGSTPEVFFIAYDDVISPEEENSLELSEFSYAEHSKVEQGVILEESLPEDRGSDFWLPLILSLDYWRSITRSKQQVRTVSKDRRIVATYDVTRLISNMPVEDELIDLDFYLQFISMWKTDRIVDITYWKVIGQAMFTLEHGDPRGLNGWIGILEQAYKKASKPNCLTGHNIRKKCSEAYSTFISGEIDITSLAYYARIDSPEKYYDWHDKWVVEALTGSMSGTHAVIGRAFFRLYWLEYMADTRELRTTWYRHVNHRLMRDLAGISLRIAMSNNFLALYTSMKSNVEHQKITLAANAASCDLAISLIDKVINNLGNQLFKRYLLGDLSERFRVPDIVSFIDANRELTLIKNGVLCVSAHEILFREGKPQDYLVKSFDAAYMQDYSWSHPRVKELMQWSFITFIDPEVITFHWKFLASLLRGGNNDKKLVFWSGASGNNMKTTWQKYVSMICGAKCVGMPINYFTMGKGAANNATPAEARLPGARLMFSEEAEKRTPFLVSIVKSEVGNDKRVVRELYGEPIDVNPQHKTVVVVNDPPPIGKEPATEERVVILDFGSQAILKAPKTEKEQIEQRKFPRDLLFEKKLPSLVNAGLWVMVQIFPVYSREGISNQPEAVLKATRDYWDSIDKYVIFTEDHIIKDEAESLDPFVLYTEFYRWHERSYKKMDIPDKKTILTEFTKKLGVQVDGAWRGYTLKKR